MTASFENIGGLKTGSRVSMSGVEIGRVSQITFDSHRYRATVLLRMSGEFKLIPRDSEARIVTEGILGGQSIGLIPGGAVTYLAQGDEIPNTRSAFVLEKSIGQLVAHFISSSGRTNTPSPR